MALEFDRSVFVVSSSSHVSGVGCGDGTRAAAARETTCRRIPTGEYPERSTRHVSTRTLPAKHTREDGRSRSES